MSEDEEKNQNKIKDLNFFSGMLKNKKISSHRVRREKNQRIKHPFTFKIQKVDETKTRIKIPNKTPWSACNGKSMDTKINILGPKTYNL